MNLKKLVFAIVLTTALSSLLMNRAFAVQIKVFAPKNYAGQPPSNATAFYFGMGVSTIGSKASINEFNGGTTIVARPRTSPSPGSGLAATWFDTGPYLFNGTTQTGSAHADTYLYYSINSSGAGVRVYLYVEEWNGTALNVWTKRWSDATPTSGITKTVDLGINPSDLSSPGGVRFQWRYGCVYRTFVLMHAYAGPNSEAIIEGKYDDALWITYYSSPGEDWVQLAGKASIIKDVPLMGPVGTEVMVNGTGFGLEMNVYVYYDGGLVNQTRTDISGNFMGSFKVPSSGKGPHVVRAIDALENTAQSFFDVFIESAPVTADLNDDGAVDIFDAIILACNFGKTDPNVDPPETGGAKEVSISMPVVASISVVPIGLFIQRQKLKKTKTRQS